MALWPSKSNKQLDLVGKATLNAVGLCDSEVYTWVYDRNMIVESPQMNAMIVCHLSLIDFFLSLVSLTFSNKLSERRSIDLFNELKNNVVPKAVSMLPSSRGEQAEWAANILENMDSTVLSYRQYINEYSDWSELENLILRFLVRLTLVIPELKKDDKRFEQFYNAIREVIKVSLTRTKLIELAESLE